MKSRRGYKIPERYARNLGTIGAAGQKKLSKTCVAVVGLGGLGGHVVELLSRVGIGALILADPDVWTENNLNRQILCVEKSVGKRKVDTAEKRVRLVNSALTVKKFFGRVTRKNAAKALRGADIIVDATDGVQTRLELQDAARKKNVPLVSAAIAGWTGLVTSIFPGDAGWRLIYKTRPAKKGIEEIIGNPTPTPAVAAALEVVEVIKIAAHVGGRPLRDRFLFFDLSCGEFTIIDGKPKRARK